MRAASGTMPRLERRRDAERTKADILDVARHEFARRGYAGARIDEIAARTRTTKRMIYYYFDGKRAAVPGGPRARLRRGSCSRADARRRAPRPGVSHSPAGGVELDHHEANPDFNRLVSIENIDRGEHIAKTSVLASLNTTAIDIIASILDAGHSAGVFTRDDVDALDVHMLISSFCIFRLANKHTFGAIFGRDLTEKRRRAHYRRMLGDVVVSYLTH